MRHARTYSHLAKALRIRAEEGHRAPKLGRLLRAAIRTIFKVLPEHKCYHLPVLVSGNECISGKTTKTISLFKVLLEVDCSVVLELLVQ